MYSSANRNSNIVSKSAGEDPEQDVRGRQGSFTGGVGQLNDEYNITLSSARFLE